MDELQATRVETARSKLEIKVRDINSNATTKSEELKKMYEDQKEKTANVIKELKESKRTFDEIANEAVGEVNTKMEAWKAAEEAKMSKRREVLTSSIKEEVNRVREEAIKGGVMALENSKAFKEQNQLLQNLVMTVSKLKTQEHRNTIAHPREANRGARYKGRNETQIRPREYTQKRDMMCNQCRNRGYEEVYRNWWRHNNRAREMRWDYRGTERNYNNGIHITTNPTASYYKYNMTSMQPSQFGFSVPNPISQNFQNNPYQFQASPHFWAAPTYGRPWVC